MRRWMAWAATAASCLVAVASHAGVELTMTMEGGPAGGGGGPMKIELDADRMRQTTGAMDMIYRADQEKAWMLNDAAHSYREMNPQTMQQQRARMDAAMQQMQAKLQSMPEAQRKQIEAMMGKNGMGAAMGQNAPPPAPPTYTKDGPAKTIGKWSCTPYKVSGEDGDHQELCIATLTELGLKPDDLKIYGSFTAFMRQMLPAGMARQVGFSFDGMTTKAIGYEGFPVQWTRFDDDGKVDMQVTTTSVERKTIPASTFDLPAGYTQQEMPGMPPGRPEQ